MIIKGGSRANGKFYVAHLSRVDTNESVRVVETRGLVADDIEGAFQEMAGVASGTRCKNFFYVASLNPYASEHLTPEQWEQAADTLERHLGLDGQPRLIVEHLKEGRTHQHVVWSRINLDSMTAISDSLTYPKHERAAREIEQEFGLEPVESVLVPGREGQRPERRPDEWESFRAEAIDPHKMKAELTALYREADSGLAFKAAIEEAGYILARGDRRDFCVIDQAGDAHSLGRRISGIKAAELRARMSEIDRETLPSVAEARELAQASAGGNAGGNTPERDSTHDAPTGNPADWIERLYGTPDDWVERPYGTPADWVERPYGTPADWVERPYGTPADWKEASSGQGCDQRPEHTAWESFAGQMRGYWERLVEFAQDETSGARRHMESAAHPHEETDADHPKSWLARVMDSKPMQAGRHLMHGWGARGDGAELIEGIRETAAIVEDIIAQGPRAPHGTGSADSQQPSGGTAPNAFDRIVSADKIQPRARTVSAFDAATTREAGKPPPAPSPEPEQDGMTPDYC